MSHQEGMMRVHGTTHAILMIVFSFLACIAVTLRLWSRKIQNLAVSVSDGLIILGLIFSLGEAGLNVYGCCFPEAWKTEAQRSPEYMNFVLRLAFISPIVWATAVTLIRASVITLYMHIFPSRSFRFICYGALAFNVLFLASAILAECLICRPVALLWDFTIQGGSCGNLKARDLAIAIINLIQDIVVVALPMPALWGLQMATGRKLVISCMFGLGLAICAVTSYRVYISSTIGVQGSPSTIEAYSMIALLASLEALLGIITACSPMFKIVFITGWNSLPKRSRERISGYTSAAGSILAHTSQRLHLPSIPSISFSWFSAHEGEYGKQTSGATGGLRKSVDVEEFDVREKGSGKIHVREEFDVESVRSGF